MPLKNEPSALTCGVSGADALGGKRTGVISNRASWIEPKSSGRAEFTSASRSSLRSQLKAKGLLADRSPDWPGEGIATTPMSWLVSGSWA